MTYQKTLQENLSAIENNEKEIARIDALIDNIIKSIGSLDGEEKKQAKHILLKATEVYKMLQADHERCQEHGSPKAQEIARHINATAALLSAKPGSEEQTKALQEILTISNELSNQSTTRQCLGAAMLALGIVMVGAAVALGVCFLLAAGPFAPIAAASSPLAVFAAIAHSLNQILCVAGGSLAAGLGVFSAATGTSLILEGREVGRAANRMSELHGSFFTSKPDGEKDATTPGLAKDEAAREMDNMQSDTVPTQA